MVYYPRFSRRNDRLRIIAHAVNRIADSLEANMEISPRKDVLSVWVYLKGSGNEKVPVYSDWGKDWNENDVFQAIKNKLYGLSYRPEHAVLQVIRRM
jgi:hypothetical protein